MLQFDKTQERESKIGYPLFPQNPRKPKPQNSQILGGSLAMAVNSREQALSLLAAANNHGDLAVKLSSLRQVKDILSSADPSFASEVFPFLVELQTSHEPLVRKFLLEVIEEIGLRALEHSSVLMSVLLALLKDEDHSVARQSISSGTKFFCTILEEMAWQFHRHGKVERWAEDIWMAMIEFKDAVCSLVFEPVSVEIRLLAFKFLETCILLFTPDAADSDGPTSGGTDHRFNISWVATGHPMLDPAKLTSEANRLSARLSDMLQSSSRLPGSLTITTVNCMLASTFMWRYLALEIPLRLLLSLVTK